MLESTNPETHTIDIMCCTQLMKALDIATPLPTPNGWTTMGDVQAGDQLFDEKGNACNVLGVTDVMLRDRCFEVEFSDGAVITCDEGHKWTVDDQPRGLSSKKTVTIDTGHLFGTFKKNGRNRYAIPVSGPLDLPESELTIPPYLLGVWLGDGNSYSCNLTVHEDDYAIVENLKDIGVCVNTTNQTDTGVLTVHMKYGRNEGRCRRGHTLSETGETKYGHCAECHRQQSHSFQYGSSRDEVLCSQKTLGERLADLNLIKGASSARKSNSKHIPDVYLRSSIEQRFELLQGLMDTDGTIGLEGRPSFSTNNSDFADQVLELVLSLGFKGRVYRSKAICNGKDCGYSYNVSFMAYDDTPVFKLARKRNRQVSQAGRRTSETKRRRIVDVRAVDAVPVKCLAVDSESHLYLCGREMIPTHNTELLNNFIGFHIHQDPAPMMLIQPTTKLGEDWSKDRFDTMRRDTPVIKERVKEARARDSKTTILHKDFPGGHLTIVGSNSPTDLASRPIRVVLADEVDKYPLSAGREGSPLKLAEERADSFWNRKFIRTCSPTIAGASLIESEYLSSDQRKPFVECPHCGTHQVMEFDRVKWDKSPTGEHLTDTARYYCIECDKPWDEKYRMKIMRTEGAISWRQTAPFTCCGEEQEPPQWDENGRSLCSKCGKKSPYNGHAGFWASKLYSPWSGLDRVAAKWIAAVKANDDEALKVFYNTQLGQTFQIQGDAPEWKILYDRRDQYALGEVPMGALVLTAGIDIQRDRIEMHVWGWGRGMESWLVDFQVFEGATADIQSPAWDNLKRALRTTYQHEAGSSMNIFRAAVDTGDGVTTSVVYEWVRKQGPGQVFAIKGDREKFNAISPVDGPRFVDVNVNGKKQKRGLKLWLVSGPVFKSELYRQLKLDKPLDEDLEVGVCYPEGYVHLPQNITGEWVQQLVAETLTTEKNKFGFSRLKWVQTRERNEALDCRVYARSMAWAMGMDRWKDDVWSKLEARLGANIELESHAVTEPETNSEASEPEVQEKPANDNKPAKKSRKKRQSTYL